jgi:hypothetical protein
MMSTRSLALAAALTVPLLAGASGASAAPSFGHFNGVARPQSRAAQSTPRLQGSSFMSPAVTAGPLLYISDYQGGVVNVYSQHGTNQSPIGQIAGLYGPTGLAVDKGGDLYVYESYGEISVYHKGATIPYSTLTGLAGGGPSYSFGGNNVALDAAGNVYAIDGNFSNVIEIYAKREVKRGGGNPTRVLLDSNVNGGLYDVAVDSKGDVFDTGVDNCIMCELTGVLDEFPAGSKSATVLQVFTFVPVGLSVDASATLYVNESFGPLVFVIAPPYTGSSSYFSYSGAGLGITVTKTARDLWLANASAPAGQKYRLATGNLVDSTSTSELTAPHGIALSN